MRVNKPILFDDFCDITQEVLCQYVDSMRVQDEEGDEVDGSIMKTRTMLALSG